ncbi:hypothetical protein EVAR_21633_1 [Eumeta japonica]|uniref:Uncharacterized protein n=1 Tax=Eumeta variegata TaxID=151549 RepID=A0A4C1UXL5_EUMVA|nr:hypothetical protein EVAR_21633_1 [Eumeta japonica]
MAKQYVAALLVRIVLPAALLLIVEYKTTCLYVYTRWVIFGGVKSHEFAHDRACGRHAPRLVIDVLDSAWRMAAISTAVREFNPSSEMHENVGVDVTNVAHVLHSITMNGCVSIRSTSQYIFRVRSDRSLYHVACVRSRR